jgi:amidase/aspartyl-tRNA(Asn)/glutamyl-tRNA(Gln) amidotransferase subunit A
VLSNEADLAYASATEVAAAIRSRAISPVDAVGAAARRIEARNPTLTAFVHLALDEALEQARAAEETLMRGGPIGPLHGVPTAMKDLFDFKPGWPSTFGGIPALAHLTMDFSCSWVERMEAAGAIVMGKTNSPVLGYSGVCDNPLFGPTGNPFAVERNSGGSSGGSAAAVADGMVAFAEATDGGGSARIPAAWCGVVGFKQSLGRVPLVIRPNAFGPGPFVFEGLVARTVQDIAVGLTVLSGTDPRDPFAMLGHAEFEPDTRRSVAGMRVAYSPDLGGIPVDRRVAAVVEEAVHDLAAAGATVEEVSLTLPRDQLELAETWCRLIAAPSLQAVDGLAAAGIDLLADHRAELPAHVLRWLDEARTTTLREYLALQTARTEVYDMFQAVFADHDLLVSPTVACLPVENTGRPGAVPLPAAIEGVPVDPAIGWTLTYPANLTGHPAASVPAGQLDGLPVGLQVMGRLGADGDVLAAAGALERIRPWSGTYAVPAGRTLA